MKIILASTSRYRRELFSRLKLPFTVESPEVDESALKRLGLPPQELAQQLALKKANAVFSRNPEAIVIGSDQVAALEGEILGKPGTIEKAVLQLQKLQGKTHELITAVAVVGNRSREFCDVTRLTMAPHEPAALQRYVEADQPLDCAGSYKIESLGIALFQKIESADQSAIQGLPLIQLTTVLREFGVTIP